MDLVPLTPVFVDDLAVIVSLPTTPPAVNVAVACPFTSVTTETSDNEPPLLFVDTDR